MKAVTLVLLIVLVELVIYNFINFKMINKLDIHSYIYSDSTIILGNYVG